MLPVHPTLEQAWHILGCGRIQAFTRALEESVQDLNNLDPVSASDLDRTAKAIFINRLWYGKVHRSLFDDPGIVRADPRTAQGQHHLVVDEQFIVRHKMLGAGLRTSNYPTLHSRRWDIQAPLDGLPSIGRLNFGMRLDPTVSVIKDAFLTLPMGPQVLWVWQVLGEPSDDYGISMPLARRRMAQDELFAYTNLAS